MPELLWDDLRIFLACSAQGSLRRASEALGVSASTIARALDRLEKTVGYRLFARDKEGLRLTDDGRFMLDEVQAMERATFSIARRSSVGQDPLRGIVRVAITEGLGTYWVLPKLLPFTQAHRLLTMELRCTMDFDRCRAAGGRHLHSVPQADKPRSLRGTPRLSAHLSLRLAGICAAIRRAPITGGGSSASFRAAGFAASPGRGVRALPGRREPRRHGRASHQYELGRALRHRA